jgi:hypothetical protein
MRSNLTFTVAEMKRLIYELDHPSDMVSHAANLSLRRDFLVEKKRRLNCAVSICKPGATQDDEAFRHTRLAKDIRDVDAALRSVNDALNKLGSRGPQPFTG